VTATLAGGRRLKISGEAFGYGALEEDDDMAVYSKDDLSQYDFEIGSLSRVPKQPTPKAKKLLSSGGDVIELEGFMRTACRVSHFIELKRRYRAPEIPRGWKPKSERLIRTVQKK